MEIAYFTFNPFQENTYVLYDTTGECLIIDPGCYQAAEKKTPQRFYRPAQSAPRAYGQYPLPYRPRIWQPLRSRYLRTALNRTPRRNSRIRSRHKLWQNGGLARRTVASYHPICAQWRHHTIWQNNVIGLIHARALARQHIALSRSIGHAHRRRCIILSKHRTHRPARRRLRYTHTKHYRTIATLGRPRKSIFWARTTHHHRTRTEI
jgi:hypothetical protein